MGLQVQYSKPYQNVVMTSLILHLPLMQVKYIQ